MVTSKNSTKAGFKGATADAEAAATGIAAIFEKMHGKIGKSMAGLAGGLGAAGGILGAGAGLLALAGADGAGGGGLGGGPGRPGPRPFKGNPQPDSAFRPPAPLDPTA